MDKLDNLIEKFKPQRAFYCSYGRVEVDGIMVRVAEEGGDGWRLFNDESGKKYYAIAVEDMLQDPAIIRSARVSTGRDSKDVDEKAERLIQSLWRDRHMTPFEGGVIFRLRFDVPIAYAQPLFRLFASFNEFSGRYSVIDGKYYTPTNLSAPMFKEFEKAEEEAQAVYKRLLELGVAKEMARLAHLYRFHTKFYMTISLRHIMEFLSLANVETKHTQTEFWEIRNTFEQIIQTWTPWAFEAFKNSPRLIDFKWVRGKLRNSKRLLTQLPSERTVRALNKGFIKLFNSYGNQDLMILCLDDFPNPSKAFGHGAMTFLIKMPIFVFRQWVRHRHGTITELTPDFDSLVEEDSFYVPDRFRAQAGKSMAYQYIDMENKENEIVKAHLAEQREACKERYKRLRKMKMPAEMAAMILPYSFYVSVIWTVSVEGLINFLHLRKDMHAQWEIRQYADLIGGMFRDHFPEIVELYNEGKI